MEEGPKFRHIPRTDQDINVQEPERYIGKPQQEESETEFEPETLEDYSIYLDDQENLVGQWIHALGSETELQDRKIVYVAALKEEEAELETHQQKLRSEKVQDGKFVAINTRLYKLMDRVEAAIKRFEQ